MIGKSTINNQNNQNKKRDRLYRFNKNNYPELFEDLIITGGHSILVDELTELQKANTKKYWKTAKMTENKYRLLTCINENCIQYNITGSVNIYHFALEHNDSSANYGIYANGLLVETCDKRYLIEKSNMKLL